jgi:hypothetical protein
LITQNFGSQVPERKKLCELSHINVTVRIEPNVLIYSNKIYTTKLTNKYSIQ